MVNPSDLRARRARLSAELSKLDELIGALDAYANEFAPDLLAEPAIIQKGTRDAASKSSHFVVKPNPPQSPRTKGYVSPMVEATTVAVTKFLNENNRPMTLSQIHDAVVAAGVPVPSGGDPRNVVGTRLHRSKAFRTISGKGWWFKNRPDPTDPFAPKGADENGAPAATLTSAPEAGETAISPIDGRPGLVLVG